MVRISPLLAPAGALVFTLSWIVLGAISPGYRLFDLVIDPYSPISQPISGLGLGVTGPWMTAGFIVSGALIAAGTLAAIGRISSSKLATAGLVLIAMLGAGMIVDGVFNLESVMLHLVGFLLAVPVPAAGMALLAIALRHSHRPLSIVLAIGSVITIGLFAAFMITFDPYSAGDNTGYSGLLQRTLVTSMLAVVSVVAVTAFRNRPART